MILAYVLSYLPGRAGRRGRHREPPTPTTMLLLAVVLWCVIRVTGAAAAGVLRASQSGEFGSVTAVALVAVALLELTYLDAWCGLIAGVLLCGFALVCKAVMARRRWSVTGAGERSMAAQAVSAGDTVASSQEDSRLGLAEGGQR